jgi:hypothetical protein
MSVSLPNGSTVAIASGYGSALTVTALTNANPAVATSTAHGLSNGDYVEITSGWSRLNNKVVRVAGVTANTFELEGIDTSSTAIYPAGTGTGSVREVTGWTQISQILASSSTGGEQQFLTYQFLEADAETQIPTTKSAGGMELSIGDDPTLAGFIALVAANDDRLKRALRITLASDAKILYNAYCSINKTPSLTVNELMASQATLSFLTEPVRYAS